MMRPVSTFVPHDTSAAHIRRSGSAVLPRPYYKLATLIGLAMLLLWLGYQPTGRADDLAAPQTAPAFRIFDGSTREILYRTSSHAGEKQLQELLRMMPGGEKFTVLKMPYKWTVEQQQKYPVQVRRMNNNFGSRFKIKDAQDTAAIAAGAALLKEEADKDLGLGLQAVFYHTGHYNENSASGESVQTMYNDRLAFQAAARDNKNPRVAFIDCLTVTKEHFPATVRGDGFHASETANYLEGLEIVRAMAAHDGVELPLAVEKLVAEKVARASQNAEAITVTYPSLTNPIEEELHVGDTITVRWTTKAKAVPGVYVMLHAVFNDDYYLSEPILVDAKDFGSFTWKVALRLPRAGNRPGKASPQQASPSLITSKDTQNGTFCFRIISNDLSQAADIYAFSARFKIDTSGKPREAPRHFEVTAGNKSPGVTVPKH